MLSTFVLLVLITPQTTWHVDTTGIPPGTGTAADPYTRIDFAVAQAGTMDGDTILVQAGDYLDEAIDFAGKDLRVVSAQGPDFTTLRNTPPVAGTAPPLVTFSGGESPAAILEGFTLDGSGGAPDPADPSHVGGADLWIENAFPTVRNCVLTSNGSPPATSFGRAVFARGPFPFDTIRFEDCEFRNNSAGPGRGGAFYMEDTRAEFQDCTISSSGGGDAGACVAKQSTIHMYGCSLENNSTGSTGAHGFFEDCVVLLNNCSVSGGFSTFCGAGLALFDGSLWIVDSRFSGNSSTCGGALYLVGVSATIETSDFDDNAAFDFDSGGAILQSNGQLHLIDCNFTQNFAGQGGAIAAFSTNGQNGTPDPNAWTRLEGCELTANLAEALKNIPQARGGAICAFTTLTAENCKFEANVADWGAGSQPGTGAFGGAMYLGSAGQITDSTFVGNRARAAGWAEGGAVYTQDTLDLAGSLLFDNHVEDALAADGGALSGEVQATSCTLRANTCANGGHSAMQAGSLTHCIVWQHAAPRLPIDVSSHYSLIEGGADGLGIQQADPLFWGTEDAHLMPGSPAIDAGDASLPLDADGTRADLGALPFDPSYCGPGCTGQIGTNSCVAQPNSTGQPATLLGIGSERVADDLLILHAGNLPAGMPGYFLASQGPLFLPGFGGSDGVLCVGPPEILRFNDQVRWSGPNGQITQRLALDRFPQNHGVLPGDTWYFQLWHRDYNGVNPSSNTTPALRVDFQ